MSTTTPAIIQLRLRVLHHNRISLGPGKADLLDAIAATGSISQAAKQLGMSYRRAWLLVDTMNQCFSTPLVATKTGGAQGGGTQLTALGLQVLPLFRQMEDAALQAAAPFAQQLAACLADPIQASRVTLP